MSEEIQLLFEKAILEYNNENYSNCTDILVLLRSKISEEEFSKILKKSKIF